jgi:vitamin B12 transporter
MQNQSPRPSLPDWRLKAENLPVTSYRLFLVWAAFAAAHSLSPASGSASDAPPAFLVSKGDTIWLAPPMDVVGSRVPAALPAIVRQVDILAGEELVKLPGRSAAELLQSVPGVVTGQRQQYGVQSDLTIRGSTFEQVQVLLDGFDASDPQTGHHLMDLPLGRQDIERLEVLKGQGSALYGSGSFGGVVNVVSKRPAQENGGEVALSAGGLGLWEARGSVDAVSCGGDTGLRLSFDRFRIDGQEIDRPDGGTNPLGNEADTWSGSGRFLQLTDTGETDLFVGWSKRRFGALDFYAPFASWERTQTFFASARYNRKISERWTLEPRLFLRRHDDRFVLDRNNPDRYINDHQTRRVGSELRGIGTLGASHSVAFGLEGVYEDLDSRGVRGGVDGPAMGEHLRRRFSASTELDRHRGRLRWQLGGRLDAWHDRDPRTSGTGALSYDLSSWLTARTSAGSVFRIPTWTELFYTSPVNLGLSDLKPEHGWTWDAGLDVTTAHWTVQAAYFERYENDLIEWAMAPAETAFRVMNIAEGKVRGVETGATWRHGRGHMLSAGWAWLEKESDLPAGYLGRYTLLTPRHVLTSRGTAILPGDLTLTLTGRYIERTDGPADYRLAFLLDGRLDWEGPASVFASLAGTNLLDREHEEVPGVPMPGVLTTLTVGRRF